MWRRKGAFSSRFGFHDNIVGSLFFGELYLKQNSEKDLIKIVEDILLKKSYANINERGEI